MDNLTHSLVGALLGQMGLKRKTGLAMPTLIIAANIPDIDVLALALGGHQHLAIRRGITHGPIAMVILPLLLWGAMIWFDNWQARRGKRPEKRLPLHKGWLLGLAYIGCLSHPLFDWFNSYGIRLLEPFSSEWFYGDTLFIIDVWIWVVGFLGLWLSLRREKLGSRNFNRPAIAAVLAVLAYINGNAIISKAAVSATDDSIKLSDSRIAVDQIVANPVPVAFWRREVLFGSKNNYYRTEYSVFQSKPVQIDVGQIQVGKDTVHIIEIEKLVPKNPDLAAFLFWSRMPYDGVIVSGKERTAVVSDARFSSPLVSGRFSVVFPLNGFEGMNDPSTIATCSPCLDE